MLIVVLAEIVAFGSFFRRLDDPAQPRGRVSLSGPGVLRATVGAGLYLTVLGLFAMAIGALIRHTAGAISTVIGVVLVLPILTGLLPDQWCYNHLNAYLPRAGGIIDLCGAPER